MATILVTGPASEPVTLTEAKAQCSITSTDHDTLLGDCIADSRSDCETETGRSLITQTLRLELEAWPCYPHEYGVDRFAIWLPRPPVASVTSVKYLDTSGTEITMVENTDYIVQISDPITRIVPGYGVPWPAVRADHPAAIKIVYVAGWTSSTTVPPGLRRGIRMRLAHYFMNRSDEISGESTAKFLSASEKEFAKYDARWVFNQR